jgi:hypothetical protein
VRYTLFTQPATFAAASAHCRALGANLVSYTSAAEQLAAERALALQGALIPSFHLRYWLGLTVVPADPANWGNFTWLDGSLQPGMVHPFPIYGGYSNWWASPTAASSSPPPGSDGLVPPEGALPEAPSAGAPPPPDAPQSEPNNLDAPELCAAASFKQATDAGAWGWGDASCGLSMPFICKASPPPPPLLRLPPSPPPRPPPSPVNPTYTSPTSRTLYVFNATPADFSAAGEACAAAGGYLVTYATASKQLEVERALAQQNALLGARTPFYWMGLRVDNDALYWPFFSWAVNGSGGAVLTSRSYTHWGTDRGGAGREPNNVCPPEDCAGANYTQAYDGAWGWSDAACDQQFPSLCEVPLQRPPPPPQAPPAAGGLLRYSNASARSFSRGARYALDTTPRGYDEARVGCQALGGALAVFESLEEQAEVEAAYARQGGLRAPGGAGLGRSSCCLQAWGKGRGGGAVQANSNGGSSRGAALPCSPPPPPASPLPQASTGWA